MDECCKLRTCLLLTVLCVRNMPVANLLSDLFFRIPKLYVNWRQVCHSLKTKCHGRHLLKSSCKQWRKSYDAFYPMTLRHSSLSKNNVTVYPARLVVKLTAIERPCRFYYSYSNQFRIRPSHQCYFRCSLGRHRASFPYYNKIREFMNNI